MSHFLKIRIPTGADNNATWLPADAQNPYQLFELIDEPRMTEIMTQRIDFWSNFNLSDLYR